MKKTDIGVVGFMYAVCAFFFLMSRDLKKGARIYPTLRSPGARICGYASGTCV